MTANGTTDLVLKYNSSIIVSYGGDNMTEIKHNNINNLEIFAKRNMNGRIG